jgi:hypothetical protein
MELGAWSQMTRSIAAALVVFLGACSPTTPAPSSTDELHRPSPIASSSQPTAITSPERLLPSPTAKPLGVAPEGCPGPEPRTETVADFIGPVAFGPPLWAGVYATYNAATNTYSAPDAPLTEHGWRIKILYLLEPGHDTAVELVGEGVEATDGAVVFAVEGTAPSTVATFDPGSPAIPVQHEGWREYPTYAYFPSAGCYLLTATWTGGRSELGFGLGR